MDAAIVTDRLRKAYKKVAVLDDVSFRVETGSIFALLGANGSGKTTTINILTTLIKADGGTATVCGFDLASQPGEVRRVISMTGQFAAVDNVLSARENLVLIGELRHVSQPARLAKDLLAQFDLADAADRRVGTFSGGMRRRLDIAMSLIGQPKIIFLDEPTTGLDPQSRNEVWQTTRNLAQGGTTVFLTTQYLEEADQLADHIAVLHEGKIAASGTAGDLKRLVPSGLVDLVFTSDNDLTLARRTLMPSFRSTSHDNLTLRIATDGSVADLTRLLNQLRDAGIEPSAVEQKLPTLDDVFFHIVENRLVEA